MHFIRAAILWVQESCWKFCRVQTKVVTHWWAIICEAVTLIDQNTVTLPAQPQSLVSYSFLSFFLYPAGEAAGYCILLVSSFFFLHSRSLRLCISSVWLHSRSLRLCISSVRFLTQSQSATVFCICTISFFCQHFKVLYLRHDLTDIDQTWSQVSVDHPIYVIWPDWGQRSRRGHRVKKVIFTKKSFKSNRLRSVIMWLMYMIDLDPLYKSYGSRKSSGVIWGHWGQKFIFPKNAITRPCYIAWP